MEATDDRGLRAPVSVGAALDWGRRALEVTGVPEPSWDASLLLAWALGVSRIALLTEPERPLEGDGLGRYVNAVERRAAREPLQYITGSQGFMGLEFAVDPRVLVPRPDTEVLAEAALQYLRSLPGPGPLAAADLGTGSGALAVALAAHEPRVQVVAVDISPDALEVARLNARRNGVAARVTFRQGDLLEPLEGRRFAAIVCNPPYLGEEERQGLMPEVRDYEPRLALISPGSPLRFYWRLAATARRHLEPGGLLAVEVGQGQAGDVAELLARAWGLRPGDGGPPAHLAAVPAHQGPVPAPGELQVRLDFGGVARVVLARLGTAGAAGRGSV
ncbi:MAG: peptide chain release factor N(5)-glutamine methyltransferase [Bacillota bacterium]